MTAPVQILKTGGIGVMASDTIYGVFGSALNPATIERIYRIRYRTPAKPLIILVASIDDLRRFDIDPDENLRQTLSQYWPGPVSIVLPHPGAKWKYLHRGSGSLAFRLPAKPGLVDVLRQTGPLVSTSANHEGQPPAATIAEARAYFSNEVDFYVDAGTIHGRPSKVIRIKDGKIEVLRG